MRVFTHGVRTDPAARLLLPPPRNTLHRHRTPRHFPFPGCCRGNATALLLIPSRFRAQLLSLPGQPPPVTYPIALSFSDHTQPRPPYVPPTHPGDKQARTADASVGCSSIRHSRFFCVLFARTDRGQTPAVTMNRRRWPGRPPFNRVLAALAVIAVAKIVPQSPAAHAADDSLRSALEAISDKIGETQPPPRLVYLNTGKTDGARETRTARVPEVPASRHDKPSHAQEYENSAPRDPQGRKEAKRLRRLPPPP